MKAYPRSFLQLVTWGQLIAALPLVLMAAYAVLIVDQLANRYESVVRHVAESGRLSADLAEDLRLMELNLRRHEILLTPATLEDYEESRAVWRVHMAAFSRLDLLAPTLVDTLSAQLHDEQVAHEKLLETRDTRAMQRTLELLRRSQEETLDAAQLQIEREQAAIRESSADLVQRLLVSLLLAVGLASLFWWLIRRFLSRLIGRFERVVIALGRGDLKTPITLDGPGDMRWLGRWLEWLRKRLLSLEESRAQVLRHVSHELKTPLAAIHEGSSLLADQVSGPLTAEQARVLGIVQGNARRLQDLIDGLLRLQQAGHAAERIAYETLRFDRLVEQVAETHRLIAQESRIAIDLQVAPVEIMAGREALLTIVHNLVSNAVKFSPLGGCIVIRLSAQGGQVQLEVEDEGPGVAAKDVAQVFHPFFRGSATRHIAGAGLGLAIAREFVLAHRGTIELVAGEAGSGALFRVRLPQQASYLRRQENA